jgi:hypothetical protein
MTAIQAIRSRKRVIVRFAGDPGANLAPGALTDVLRGGDTWTVA